LGGTCGHQRVILPAAASNSACLPDVADREPIGEWIVRVDDVRRDARDPSLTAEGRYDRRVLPDPRLLDESARKHGAQDSRMSEVLVEREFSFGVQRGHLGAGAGAAG